MSIRVAVASTDGKVVNQHFGHADRFHIFEIDGEEFRFIETRFVQPFCAGGGHEGKDSTDLLKAMDGCRAVLVNRIGGGAVTMLEENGIDAIEVRGFIEDALREIGRRKLYSDRT
jgi:predicted Fe-Mo cluster-binding NifX family protein